jgi:hypothetical protein
MAFRSLCRQTENLSQEASYSNAGPPASVKKAPAKTDLLLFTEITKITGTGADPNSVSVLLAARKASPCRRLLDQGAIQLRQ